MQMKFGKWAAVAAGMLALAGCGSESAGGGSGSRDEPGEVPLAEVSGRIDLSRVEGDLVRPSVGLAWQRLVEEPTLADLHIDVVPFTGADTFTLPVLSVPPSEVIEQLDLDGDGTPDAAITLGSIFAFEDVDGNGAVGIDEQTGIVEPDRLFGLSWGHYLVYVSWIRDPQLLGSLFTNVENLTPGQVLLARRDSCNYTLTLIPVSTEITLVTFRPGADLPEDFAVEFDCPDDEEPFPLPEGGVCGTANGGPESEACQSCLDEVHAAAEAACSLEDEQVNSCIEAECADAPEEIRDRCIDAYCGPELEAHYNCIVDNSDWDRCFTDPET